jgi:Cft2 family RNA processing exonuclease
VLTHAHIDPGLLAAFQARDGVVCTPGTEALLKILLPDAHLQEEAEFANRYGYSKPSAEPSHRRRCRRRARLAASADYARPSTSRGHELTFHPAGHLLGAASALILR